MSIALRRPRLAALLASVAAFGGGAAIAASPASAASVTVVQTAVAPDPGLVDALTSLKTSVRLTGAATADESGRFVFPVTGGNLTPELKGRVGHTGGIEFKTRYGLRFGIQQFVIDTTATPTLTAVPTFSGFSLGFRVPVATIEDLTVRAAGDATVVGGTVKFNDIGAWYVNTFLGRPAIKRGTVFGQAEATVTLGA